ncbi:hypothetical protein CSW98_06130 [Vibrio sp. HA2012]|uniref:SUMF1/EgtB/PvdO family nonheme iron enzyme n=1 Tax=Vibrio sp. HA2012 TaxID=1971595 RepID=UPI000C2C6F6A|nr:SUMF1/EgtB/PvdO family nonheme iron enzyme [Vibrio sp. HA2012]PJC87469.1 hypothetical protein CSW98_06130 [Vibrio sp. HA2012]
MARYGKSIKKILTVFVLFIYSVLSIHMADAAYSDSTTGIEFIPVKGGCYPMGDIFGVGYDTELPVHEVCVDDFYMGKYEVTQTQWQAVMGDNPSDHQGSSQPVENVSWKEVNRFIDKLNQKSGKKYRLPTEAEWEYAARSGGKDEKYAGSNNAVADISWFKINSNNRPHSVGQKRPNGLGLYDMSGNVWEWCQDGFDERYYADSPRKNPQGYTKGSLRVSRGGSWLSDQSEQRTTRRNMHGDDDKSNNIGFRLVYSESDRKQPSEDKENVITAKAKWVYNKPTKVDREPLKSGANAYVAVGNNVALLAFGERRAWFVILPKNGMEMVLDVAVDGRPLSTLNQCKEEPYLCINSKSQFVIPADGELIQQLKRGKELQVSLLTAESKNLTLVFPLTGSTAAIDQVFNTLSSEGTTPVMQALLLRDDKLLDTYLQRGDTFDFDFRDKRGRAPLEILGPDFEGKIKLTHDDREMMIKLIRRSGDVNALTYMSRPILTEMARHGEVDIVKALLNKGANTEVRGNGYFGWTALFEASYNKNFNELYTALVAAGADKSALNNDGENLLLFIVDNSAPLGTILDEEKKKIYIDNAIFLLEQGFPVNEKNKDGDTALFIAATAFNKELTQALLDHGANIFIKNENGLTVINMMKNWKNYYIGDEKPINDIISLIEDSKKYKVYFKNKTSEQVMVYIHYKSMDDSWITKRWRLDSGEDAYLINTMNGIFYWHAEGVYNNWVWRGDDTFQYINTPDGDRDKAGFIKVNMKNSYRGKIYRKSLVE